MKILIVGATGATGRHVVDQALRRGHDVVALARNRPDQDFPDVGVVLGDVRDRGTLAEALAGAQAVVSCLGVRLGQDPGTVRSDGTEALVTAMTEYAVPRLIAVSSVGVGDSRAGQSRPARMLWPYLAGRQRLAEADRAEQRIRCAPTNLSWTIVRPPRLTDGPAAGSVDVGPQLRTGLGSTLARADLATVLLDQLDDDRFSNVAVTAVQNRDHRTH